MSAAARIRPLDLFPREEWERLSARNAWMGPLLLVHAWLIIAAAMALSIWSLWFVPVHRRLLNCCVSVEPSSNFSCLNSLCGSKPILID